ncbi:hypothetical protein TTHERM_00559900 (macronuclear) [Tetrahymena thermophila SB210]|uniref:EGF-like domain-containing protein n=1 Tax=Tetrahymena thermophila (strain SB210) TaxID=312017 RepID=I7M0M9_TETTS|nr:hypothetical protein TTHERM_00559900 [Tetrahymena thermophila SB210]EAR89899.2 hypothetical protein TTHERM_00559900 [Tetrahymena thermophila SB210]|eukprot:XP_001010144.2 hypothetical protein TTHERM_00559900 [Tetrahymena thermophila SB210]
MKWGLYLIDDYLTKVQIINSTFKDNQSIKLNNPADSNLVSDVIDFQTIFIIIAYDYQRRAFRYFNVENLQELQSTGVNLPFIDYKTFIQYQKKIFIDQYTYDIAYIPLNNQVQVTQNPQGISLTFKSPYTHLVNYAFSYSVTYQVMQDSNQQLIKIYQAYNFCAPHCFICASTTTCSICYSPHYLDSQFQCVDNCPTQFIQDNIYNQCICRPNSSLVNSSCPCNDGYVDINDICQPCPPNCKICNNQLVCSACDQNYYLTVQETCVPSCPPLFIPDVTNTKCICRQNSNLQNSQCPCNSGYVDINNVCTQCPPNCKICNNQLVCSACDQNYYLTVQETCVPSCPPVFIPDVTNTKCTCRQNSSLQDSQCPCNSGYVDINNVCMQCPSNCQECSSQSVCTVCAQNYYLSAQQVCVSSCPPLFIPDVTNTKCTCRLNSSLQDSQCPCNSGYVDINNVCTQCPPNCKICNNQLVCSACDQNYYLTFQETCVPSCPPLFIPDVTNTKCTCRQNSSLQDSQCPCNSGYVDINNVCTQCPPNCKICNNQLVCSACVQNYYLTVQETCVPSCPPLFIPDVTNTKCTCRQNSNLQNQQCPCNSGYVDINNVCMQCTPNCKECASQSVCTVCAQNYYLSAQQVCVTSCPATFIIDSTSTKCVCDLNKILQNGICSDQCNSNNCQTCDKNNNKICTVCNPGFDLYGQTCQQVYLNYDSQIFSSNKIEQIHQQTQVMSEGALYSSILKNTISINEVFKFILRSCS